MDNSLDNRRFISLQKIEILRNKILISRKTIFNYIEYEVLLEDIDNKKQVKKEVNHGFMAIALMTFLIGAIVGFLGDGAVCAFLLLVSLVFVIVGFLTRKGCVILYSHSEGIIELWFTSKNEQNIRKFADKIIDASNTYLLNKYSNVDKDLPLENQIERLEYLKNRELLDDEKFEHLKNTLLGKRTTDESVGFRK